MVPIPSLPLIPSIPVWAWALVCIVVVMALEAWTHELFLDKKRDEKKRNKKRGEKKRDKKHGEKRDKKKRRRWSWLFGRRNRRNDGEWQSGEITFYSTGEKDVGYGTGKLGSRDNKLVPGVSVAMKGDSNFGKWVEIVGLGRRRVDDTCAGPGCKTFDVLVDKIGGANDGVKSVKWRFV